MMRTTGFFVANVNAVPSLVVANGAPHYELQVSFNIGVTWKDISAVKSTITYENGAFK